MAVFNGKTQERISPNIEKSVSSEDNLERAMLEIGQVFPQIYDRRIALPAVVFQGGINDSAIKGVTTDENYLN